MLEVLDELQLRPHRIAGTSIGAVMGLLFTGAAGTLYAGWLFDTQGHYEFVFQSFGAVAAVAFVATWFLRDERAGGRAQPP